MANTELGKAYVQIVPSAKGIKGSVSSLLSGETDSAGKSAGRSLGGSLISSLKSVIVAAGIGTFITKAISEGANLEQSFGGLETIYGNAAESAKQFAMQAAQAGISANNYAEQAVSFGASLKQAFNGDETKAIQAANTAILDMADNSAKMGTDMALIQNAYQGFAKQNYTMLDNLKLGYGGTKTEMQRLLADAQKLTGVKYDISNLGDVYDAIHVIQGELGLTGVAAAEASGTISGSFNAVKASFSNLMATMTLGQDITPALQGLVESTTAFLVNNLVPAVVNVIGTLPVTLYGLITEFYPTLETYVAEIVTNFSNFLTNNLPTIVNKGMEVLQSLVNGIIARLPAIGSAAINIITNFARAVLENLPTILQKGIEITAQLAAGIVKEIPNLFQKAKEAIGGVDWLSLGRNIIQGIVNGIKNGASLVKDAISTAVSNAWNAAKNFLGIHSPSKKFYYLGEMSDKGFAEGILKNTGIVQKAVHSMTDLGTDPIVTGVSVGVPANRPQANTGGYTQIINNYSPKYLSASEVARQTRNSTKQMALRLSIGV